MATADSPEESGIFPEARTVTRPLGPGTVRRASSRASRGALQPLQGLDEPTIVARAQDGDLSAFEHLVVTYQGRLFRLAYRMLNDRGDAEDVVQETLTAGWRALPALVDSGAFGGWVYRTATNRCLDLLRRRTARPEDTVDSAGLWPSLEPRTGDPHRSAELAAELECLSRALADLPPGQRACWVLRELHDQSYAQIGTALGISPDTVRGRLARAREKLAEAMIQWH